MRAYEIEKALDAFARAQGFVPDDPYYIVGYFNLRTAEGESVYSDEAHLWCKECAAALLAKVLPLMPEAKREDHFVCGADPSLPEDTPSHCMACGKTLDHSLTSHGVEYELTHYDENPLTDISPAEAFCIARLVESAPDDRKVAAIGRAALKAIRAGKIRQPAPA